MNSASNIFAKLCDCRLLSFWKIQRIILNIEIIFRRIDMKFDDWNPQNNTSSRIKEHF
jgi:hypothetical protein